MDLESNCSGNGHEIDIRIGFARVRLNVEYGFFLDLDILTGAQAGYMAADKGLEVICKDLVMGSDEAGDVLGQRKLSKWHPAMEAVLLHSSVAQVNSKSCLFALSAVRNTRLLAHYPKSTASPTRLISRRQFGQGYKRREHDKHKCCEKDRVDKAQ